MSFRSNWHRSTHRFPIRLSENRPLSPPLYIFLTCPLSSYCFLDLTEANKISKKKRVNELTGKLWSSRQSGQYHLSAPFETSKRHFSQYTCPQRVILIGGWNVSNERIGIKYMYSLAAKLWTPYYGIWDSESLVNFFPCLNI